MASASGSTHPDHVPSPCCYGHRDLAWPKVERHPAVPDRVSSGRMPIADQLHAVSVGTVDHRAHNPSRAHVPGRDQRLDLGQLALLLAPRRPV